VTASILARFAAGAVALVGGNGTCITLINDRRCCRPSESEWVAECRCGHRLAGPICRPCREVVEVSGPGMCIRCADDGRSPHRCETQQRT
jgi:hypothetical protein